MSEELLVLLREALMRMESEVANRDGVDRFDLDCGRCQAGLGVHSFGCRARNAILRAERHIERHGSDVALPYVVDEVAQ